MIQQIETKIEIKDKAYIEKNIFINNELYPKLKSYYYCANCNEKNFFCITPYKTGFPFTNLYTQEFLSEKEIIEKKIANITIEGENRFGKYTINNLATLYFSLSCKTCHTPHLVVFSFGEKQPGLDICQISGIWNYNNI